MSELQEDDEFDEFAQPEEERVGYGKPPKAGQFQKGRSGNPRGRPKGSKGLATLVRQNVSEKVQIKVDGKSRTVPVGYALLLRIFREGLAGKKAASDQALRLMERFGLDDGPEPEPAWDLGVLTLEELSEFHRILAKIKGCEDDYHEECRLEEEARTAEHDRVWGAGAYDRLKSGGGDRGRGDL